MTPSLLLRSFLVLVIAAIPPAVGMLIAVLLAQRGRGAADLAVIFGVLVLVSVGWLALVATLHARFVREEMVAVLDLAERGPEPRSRGDGEGAHRRLASTLDERNRQVAELASQVSRAPISDDPRLVARHVVGAARSVTGDPTWVLAVLGSSMADRLPPGIYDIGADQPGDVGELHRWASVAAADDSTSRASHEEGPWGAFVVIRLAADDDLRAVLMAPWEGRAEPSAADIALLSLVGEHATTSIAHAILYARVRAQADALDRMAAIQRDFLRSVSHDLQTPLTSIRAIAAEVRAQAGLDDQATRDLDTIEHQADRLRRMVGQLLVVSRLEAGAVEPQVEVVNPRPLVERTWSALRPPDHSLVLDVSGPPLLAVADPDRLEQVLWAILDNAVKYSPAGGAVRVSIGGNGERATLAIRDEGIGMDSDTLAQAFDQFYRSTEARRVAPDGSGIGLYAARGLMEAMGGTLSVSSQLGSGTTVTLNMPAELIEEGVAPAQH